MFDFLESFVWIDWLFVVIVIAFTFAGNKLGFIRSLIVLVFSSLGLLISFLFDSDIIQLTGLSETKILSGITMLVIVIAFYCIGFYSAKKSQGEKVKLPNSEKIMGSGIGVLQGLLIVSVLVSFIGVIGVVSTSSSWENSRVSTHFNILPSH